LTTNFGHEIDLPWTIENVEMVLAAPAPHPLKLLESPHASWALWARSQLAGSRRPSSTDIHAFNGIRIKEEWGQQEMALHERGQSPMTYFLVFSKEINISLQVEDHAQRRGSSGK
jgi:hypothetical protein